MRASAQTSVTNNNDGNAGTIPVYTGTSTFGNSVLTQSNGNVGIGRTSPSVPLDVESFGPSGVIANFLQPSLVNGGTDQLFFGQSAGDNTTGTLTYSQSATNSCLSLGIYGASYDINACRNGNVGVGYTTPPSTLTVQGLGNYFASYNNEDFLIMDSSIGPSAPQGYGFYIQQQYPASSANGHFTIGVGNSNNHYYDLAFATQGTQQMIINRSGQVGIGTTNPTHTLSVNGTIQAKEVLVNTGWSDYVFAPAYKLKSLTEVAAFIKANHHLPDIPSEAEVKENGVSLGDMQSKLLAKIEELTLQMIKLDEKNSALEKKLVQLESRPSDKTGADR